MIAKRPDEARHLPAKRVASWSMTGLALGVLGSAAFVPLELVVGALGVAGHLVVVGLLTAAGLVLAGGGD